MKTSAKVGAGAGAVVALALPLVALWEGLETRPYRDLIGRTTWCYGETVGKPKAEYTKAECDAMLQASLTKYAEPVLDCIPADAPITVKAAMTSLAYNAGSRAVCGSTAARRANALDYRGACDALMMWNKARVGGKLVPVKGLTNRRAAERALCLRGLT